MSLALGYNQSHNPSNMKSILILLFALAISFDAMAAEPYLRNVILSGELSPSVSSVLWSEQPEACVVQITFRPTKSTQQPEILALKRP